MKCKSKLYSLYSVLLAFVLLLSPISSIGSLASTTSGSENLFEYTENYVRDNFNALCRYVVKQNAIISDAIIGTWDNFTSWLDSSGNGDIWEQHPHSPIRTVNGVDNVDVPSEVLNVINQYVIYQIQQNPLGYYEAYIKSYGNLMPDQFTSYAQYNQTKEFIKNSEGYCLLSYSMSYGQLADVYVCVIPKSVDYNLVGTVNNGIFSSVQSYLGWTQTSQPWNVDNKCYCKVIYGNGTISDLSGYTPAYNNVYNNNNVASLGNGNIYTNSGRNELVYVFTSLNALKHYTSGTPQSYYLTSEGLGTNMSNWQVGSGTINTGTLTNANSTYSSVVNNIQSGWTAEEVLELVDRIISSGSGSGSGTGSGSDDDGWLDLGIFGDIGKAIAKVFGAIITAIASIFEEIIGIVTQVSDTLLQGVIFEFLSAFIGWLPDEIIALLTALFSVAVLFALVRLIREAF